MLLGMARNKLFLQNTKRSPDSRLGNGSGGTLVLDRGLSLGTMGSRELGSCQFSAFHWCWGAGGGLMEESQPA